MKEEEPVINLTPLIDVVFVILIMFMVIAPILELDQVELAEGGSEKGISVQKESPITIHVNYNNQITLNNDRVNIDHLQAALIPLRQKYPNLRPQVFHDKKAHFGTYQAVKNALEGAGFEKMDIILKPHSKT